MAYAHRFWLNCGLAFTLASFSSSLWADEFLMRDGRRLVGNLKGTKDKVLTVELAPGNLILLRQDEIKQHLRASKNEVTYVEAMKSAEDTVEFHLRQAALSKKNALPEHEAAHYRRVLDLDPDNATARASLGYLKDDDGRWVEREKLMTEGRGKVSIGGKRYRFPELVALQEAEEKAKEERVRLTNEIKKALGNVSNPRAQADARAKAQNMLDTLDGPMVSAAISDIIFPRASVMAKNAPTELKLMFLPTLERLKDAAAVQLLIRFALTPEEADVTRNNQIMQLRERSVAILKEIAPDAALMAFLGALNSNKVPEINVAGYALNLLGDERAVLPLIERVRTFQRTQVSGGGSPGQTNAGMTNGNASFSFGSEPVQFRDLPSDNVGVHLALTNLTNQDFQYEKANWLTWYEMEYGTFNGDLRRD